MAEATEERSGRVGLFTVEFGDPNNRTCVVNCLRLKVRGSWSLAKLHARPEGGRDVGSAMTAMPDIPGLRMTVLPRDKKAILFDPLEEDSERLRRINSISERARAIFRGAPWTFVDRSEHTLNDDTLKTLVMELVRKVESKCCHVVDGKLPTIEQVEGMPGRLLFDPWNNGRKPTYVDQVEDWQQGLDRQSV